MKRRITSQPIRTAVAIVVIAAAAWLFRDILLTFLIEPIGWLLWAGWRLLSSIDRSLVWLIITVASSLLIIRLVPPDVVAGQGDVAQTPQTWNSGDRLEHWRTCAARSAIDGAGLWDLRHSLEAMAAAVSETTRTPLPPPADARDHGSGEESALVRLGARISQMLPDHRRRQDARRIDDLLNWMETTLEINREQ